jgi:hypothetical protein
VAPSPQTRDAGIRRVTRLTSWAVAGAVALSAAVTFVVAKAQIGSAASTGSTRTSTSDTAAPLVIGPGTGGGGLQPPVSAPVGQSGGGGGGGGGVANSGGS